MATGSRQFHNIRRRSSILLAADADACRQTLDPIHVRPISNREKENLVMLHSIDLRITVILTRVVYNQKEKEKIDQYHVTSLQSLYISLH